MRKTAETDLRERRMPRVPSAKVAPPPFQFPLSHPSSLFVSMHIPPFSPLTPQPHGHIWYFTATCDHSWSVLQAAGALIVNSMVWMWGRARGWRREPSPNLATVSSVMTPPSLWKTILFCLHLHESSFFLLFCSQRSHGTFANIFKSCEKQDFFFLSLPPRRCFFLRRARQCQARLGSSWMPRASGSGGWWGGERGKKRLKKSYWLAVVASLFFISP